MPGRGKGNKGNPQNSGGSGNGKGEVNSTQPHTDHMEKIATGRKILELEEKCVRQANELKDLKDRQAANKKVLAEGEAAVKKLEASEKANKQLKLDLKQSQERVEKWMDASGNWQKQYQKLRQDFDEKIYQALNEGIEVGYWTGLRHSQHEHAIRIVNQFCGILYDGSDITTAKRKPITDKSVDELIKKCQASKAEWQDKLGVFQKLFESDTLQETADYFAPAANDWARLTQENTELTDSIEQHLTHIDKLEKQIHELEQNHLSMVTEVAKLRRINDRLTAQRDVQEVMSEILLNVGLQVESSPDAAAAAVASPDAEIQQAGTLDPSILSQMEDIYNAMNEMASEMEVMQDHYNDKINSVEKTYTELLSKKQQELEASQRTLSESLIDKAELEKKLKDCRVQNEHLGNSNDSKEKMNLALNKRTQDMDKELENLANELLESQHKLELATQKLLTAEQNGVEYTQRIEALESDLQRQINLYDNLQAGMNGGEDGISQAFESYKEDTHKQLKQLQTELTTSKKQYMWANEYVSRLQEDKKSLQNLIEEHEKSKQKLLADSETLESKLKEVVLKNSKYLQELDAKDQDIALLKKSLEIGNQQYDDLGEEYNTAMEKCDNLQAELNALRDSGHEMTDERRTELKHALKQNMDTIKGDMKSKYGKDIHALQLRIGSLQRENTELTKRLHGTQYLMSGAEDVRDNAAFQKLLHDYEELKQDYDDLNAENEGVFPGCDPTLNY